MSVAVEMISAQEVRDPVGGAIVEQQAPEHRLLRLDRMRRKLQSFNLGIVGHARERRERCSYILAGRRARYACRIARYQRAKSLSARVRRKEKKGPAPAPLLVFPTAPNESRQAA